jgi:sugar phosphate isomerase/epimerase
MRLGLEAGEYTLELAAELGIAGVPVAADQLVANGVDATVAPLKARGLAVCQIGAFGFNPLSPDTAVQDQQYTIVEQAIPLAVETGCPYIVINGGNYHPSGFGAGDPRNFTDAALDRVADMLKPLLDLAEKHGACLSIEPYLKTAINSPEAFLRLKEKTGNARALCVNIDVTSLYDYQDTLEPGPKVEHICTALAGHYGLGHLKGIALKEGFHIHIELAPITEDPTDWAQVLRLMAPNLPKDSWVILEHVLSPAEARMSIAFLREAALSAGVKFA